MGAIVAAVATHLVHLYRERVRLKYEWRRKVHKEGIPHYMQFCGVLRRVPSPDVALNEYQNTMMAVYLPSSVRGDIEALLRKAQESERTSDVLSIEESYTQIRDRIASFLDHYFE
jgi:hypothetical protein